VYSEEAGVAAGNPADGEGNVDPNAKNQAAEEEEAFGEDEDIDESMALENEQELAKLEKKFAKR